MNKFVIAYLIAAVSFTVYISPRLIFARLIGFAPGWYFVDGIPVAYYQIYFFTALSFGLGIIIAYMRGANIFISVLLSACGLAFFEFLDQIFYVVTVMKWWLLIPQLSLPPSGWPGFSTWAWAELVFASLALVNYRRLAIDKYVFFTAVAFVIFMLTWIVGFKLQGPPNLNSLSIYFVNTGAEVTGTLLIPFALTGKNLSKTGPLMNVRSQTN